MAVNFPDSPSNGATHSVGDIVYTYNSTKGVWADTATGSTPSLETSDNPPSSPTDGDLWFNTSDLTTYIYYADGSSNQWVKANPSQAGVAGAQGPAGATGATGGSGGSTVGTLTKSFSTNEESTITLSSAISPVPNVSVFKEIPQGGLTSKGNWDVNANATNYDFFDEKPISYSNITLTPSATGDGTFTFSSGTFAAGDVGKVVTGNSGSAVITATSGTYTSQTAFADTSTISSWTLTSAKGEADGTGIKLSGTSQVGTPLNHGTYNSTSTGITYTGYYSLYSNGGAQFGMEASHFGPDGTKFYSWTSSTNVRIWSPTTAFDISTLGNSVTNVSGFSANGGQCIRFSKTGDRAFHLGSNGYSLHSYDLSTPFDLSTKGSVTTKTMAFQGTGSVDTMGWYQDNVTVGSGGQHMGNFVISPDGSYFVGECRTGSGALVRGVMSTPYDISTLVLNQSLARGVSIPSPGTQTSRNRSGSGPAWNQGGGIWFADDGKLALWWGSAAVVEGFQYRFSTGWDFSTASGVYDGTTNNMGWSPPAPSGHSSRDVGTKALEIGVKPNGQVIMQATLFWNNAALSPEQSVIASYNLSADPNSSSMLPYNVYSPAVTGSTGQINTSSWIDLDSMVADETKNGGDIFYAVSTDDRTSWGVIKDGDGVRKIAKNNSGTWQYNNDAGVTVSTGYDLSSISPANKYWDVSHNTGYDYHGIHMGADGYHLYGVNQNDDNIRVWDLTTQWDISSAVYYQYRTSHLTQPRALALSVDGTKMYCSQNTGDTRQYVLSTAFDLTTYSGGTTTAANLGSLDHIVFKPDGTRVWTYYDRIIKEYSISTAWDLTSTVTLVQTVTSTDTTYLNSGSGKTMAWNADGTAFFEAGGNNKLQRVPCSTAWDISTMQSPDQGLALNSLSYSNTAWGSNPCGDIQFGDNGQKLYLYEDNKKWVRQFTTGASTISYGTSETWVNGTNNTEHATLQEALGAQSFNRMDKAQLQTVTDPNHYVLGDTLDLMIAPYAASGTSPLSDGVTIGYQAASSIEQAVNGTDYKVQNPSSTQVKITSLATQNLKIRVV